MQDRSHASFARIGFERADARGAATNGGEIVGVEWPIKIHLGLANKRKVKPVAALVTIVVSPVILIPIRRMKPAWRAIYQ